MCREIFVGRKYRHFKGFITKVIKIAIHTETGETLVVYECTGTGSGCDMAKCPLWKAIAKDAVEVVRCRDCRFSGSCSIEEFGCTEPDDYCSRGKRKEPDNG